jgi:folate-binding protein YgfZ
MSDTSSRETGWFGLEERALVVATGPQRQKFLHGLLSSDIQGRTAGQGTPAALMDVKGHLLALMRVLVAENEVVLEMPADRRDEIVRLLEHYRVAAPVRFAKADDVVIGLLGPLDALRTAGLEIPDLAPESHARVEVGGTSVRVARAGDLPRAGHVLHVALGSAPAVRDALGTRGLAALSRETLDALRIEEGRAWFGPDVSPENLLHETGLVAEYHSPTKGCYVGQEVIARLEARGANVNRRLRGLRLGQARPAGTILRADGKEVGRLTTASISPRLGPIAMGYVHRAQAEPGTAVDADGARAEVVALPMTE